MQNVKIVTDYPGGNIKVIEIKENTIKLEQDLRDTTEWWFYWNFCIEGVAGKEIIFKFMNGEVLGPWGPAISIDGINWSWVGEDLLINRESFKYQFKKSENKVYFSFSLPYQVKHFEIFHEKHKNYALLKRDILTFSEQGRPIPLLRIGNSRSNKDIMITCRNHACESTASYLLEGILKYLLEYKNNRLLEKYQFHIVPFVDIDGVENGDQGKCRAPHDHNRDYITDPIYKSTEAIMNYVESLNLIVGIDLHSPYKWGEENDFPFFVKNAFKEVNEMVNKLGTVLFDVTNKNNSLDKIIYNPIYDLEWGQKWNNEDRPNCSTFFCKQKAKICCSFEFPYFGVRSTIITSENSRAFGQDFAKALEIMMKKQHKDT